jgi:hypothetical protein
MKLSLPVIPSKCLKQTGARGVRKNTMPRESSRKPLKLRKQLHKFLNWWPDTVE